MRPAEDVLATARGAELLASPPGATGARSEVVLIDRNHFHILRPLGAASDALVVELVLDARSANLAAARQRFADLVSTYSAPPSSQAYRPGVVEIPNQRAHQAAAAGHPDGAATLPRRAAAPPPEGAEPDPAELVDEPTLVRIAAALRALE